MVQHTSDDAPAELSAVVDDLLNGLSAKFTSVSEEIFAKSVLLSCSSRDILLMINAVDDMSRRLDNLEATIQTSEESSTNK